jgi:hypothetical protein
VDLDADEMQRAPTRSVDLGHDEHAPFVTRGAAVDVDASEPEKLLGHGFLDGLLRLGCREQGAAVRDSLPARTIGEQAVVTDPHEALRQDVEQEATDELSTSRRRTFCLRPSA